MVRARWPVGGRLFRGARARRRPSQAFLELTELPQTALRTGFVLHGGRHELSPVLKAMGVPESIGLGAVRFSLGRWTTTEELDHVLDKSHTCA